jgi:hypothetical protein
MEYARLKIIGRLDKVFDPLFIDGLDLKEIQENQVILVCDYSEFDIPVNHIFSGITDKQKDASVLNCQIILKSVSQQMFKPFDEIPHGWKTICKFEFVNGLIPDIIYDLPEVRGWTNLDRYLYFE